MQPTDLILALKPVVDQLDRLRVRYYVGGSVASSAYGRARSTADVDVVAELKESHVDAFAASLGTQYYVSVPAIREAVRNRSCFNLIFLANSSKVDVFVARSRPYDAEVMSRARQESLGDRGDETIWLHPPKTSCSANSNGIG